MRPLCAPRSPHAVASRAERPLRLQCGERGGGAQDRLALERHDAQLRRRPAQEAVEQEQLVDLLGVARPPGGGEAGLDLEVPRRRAAASARSAIRPPATKNAST